MNNESSFLARFTTGAHLGGIGLENFEPYLMNRIMGRYNASIRDDVIKLDLTTAKMRTLAVLSVVNGPVIRDLSVFAVVEQSTLSRSLNALEKDGMIRREADERYACPRIYLTEIGRTAFEQFGPAWRPMKKCSEVSKRTIELPSSEL